MLEHLDDPNPPEPSDLVVDRIAAEGGRRLRRRRVAAGGAAVLLATLGIAGVVGAAGQLDHHDDGRIDMVDDDDTPSSTTAPTTTGSPDTTLPPDTTATTTTTTAPTVPPAGSGEPFVALVLSAAGDRVQLARVDPTTGEVVDVLAEYGMDGIPPLCCVAVSPAGDDVFYVPTAGQTAAATGGEIWGVGIDGGEPQLVTSGSNPSVSPDGARLAFVRNGTEPAVVVRDLGSGAERVFPAAVEDFVRDVAWADDDTLVVTRSGLESATRATTFPAGGPGRPIDEIGAPFGPPTGSPSGTGWTWVERRPDGRLDVDETCCALDGESYESSPSHLVVDAGTGDVVERTELPFTPAGVSTGPSGETLLLAAPAGGPDTGRLHRLVDGEPVEVPGGLRIIAAAW